ncbi:sugar ABC transporter [Sorangium cellulosum]|uniref:Sugar ABC transporter n=1 Tax=Sorangium cellulosum TaxID=56 RepID=A0A2L0F1L4_SORCE|nr:substrate-binding domain-containing protein [Sorangium cellulosum]AUX45433.1 sugar ABC transporter [Sorangium cellulosum]
MTKTGRCWTAAFGLTLMTAACGTSDATDTGREVTPIERTPVSQNEFTAVEIEATIDELVTEINKSSIEPMQMAVLLKSLNSFFAPIATGASRAVGELGAAGRVTGNVLGPTDASAGHEEAMGLQTQQIKQMVADGAEGIVITPFGEGNVDVIKEAVADGIPVVTLDTDLTTSNRQIYVGTISDTAGRAAGETLLGMLPEGPGTVLIHGWVDETWVDGVERTKGARKVFEAAGYDVLVHPVIYDDEEKDVDVMKKEIEAADPPVVGLIGLFNDSYRCVMGADAAGAPDLPIVTFDFDPKTADYMRQGRIKATHVQRQYYAGYLGPYIAYGIKSLDLDATRKILARQMIDDSRFDLGVYVVPAGKVNEFNDFLDEIGATQ